MSDSQSAEGLHRRSSISKSPNARRGRRLLQKHRFRSFSDRLLGIRRTWLMVKKDLERVGIPYRDELNRVADFHAAGRHTHITELLRNGASVPEARVLARHTDMRMTMKYTHIGIQDQTKAVARLPASASWLHYGCRSEHADSHNVASGDTTDSDEDAHIASTSDCSEGGYDTKKPAGT